MNNFTLYSACRVFKLPVCAVCGNLAVNIVVPIQHILAFASILANTIYNIMQRSVLAFRLLRVV